jgi:hypothetical protein
MSGEGSDPLCARLRAIGAENALDALQRECVDLDALSLLGEEELREIGVPLGPRVKILHSGLARTQRRDGADSEAARESREWDMEAVADVEALQQAARPRMCLKIQSGRVTRLAGGIRNAGILANEDDLPFVVLMGQVWPARCHLIRDSTLREVGVLSSPNSAVHSALLIVRARSTAGRRLVLFAGPRRAVGRSGRVGSCSFLLPALLVLAHRRSGCATCCIELGCPAWTRTRPR